MDTARTLPPAIYGLLAEFDTPTQLVDAAKRVYSAGYRRIDTFSPFPIEEAWEAIGHHDRRLSAIVLAGGIAGLLTGFALEEWVHTIAYPVNIAGKPLNSWPQFIPVMFELTILFAAIAGVLGMIGTERTAAAVSSRVQRRAVRARQPRQVLPDRRVGGPEVRSAGHGGLPQGAECDGGQRS